MIPRGHALCSALALLCATSACGGGGGAPTAFAVATSPPGSSGGLSVAPAALPGFTVPGQTATLTVTEPHYAAGFTAAADPVSCSVNGTTVASVSPASAPASNPTFTVTSGGAPGVCTIVIGDANGHTQAVAVTVTLTQGTVR